MPLSISTTTNGAPYWTAGASSCAAIREAVPHRAAAWRQLGAVLPELVEAVRPDAEVPRARGQDRVLRQAGAQIRHHLPHVDVSRERLVTQGGEGVRAGWR